MNILVCASHPDDECLSMGATIAKLTATGHTVYCWFYFSGINCNGVWQEQPKAVADILGTVWPPFVMPMTVDNESDTIPLLDIARNIEVAIDKTKPEVVYTHSIHDLNIDHRHVAEAVIVATRPIREIITKRVLSYEVPTVTDQAFGQFGIFKPTVFEDITIDNWNKKVFALGEYGSMVNYHPPIQTIAELRGAQAGFDYAEAFELIWERR